MRSVPCYSLRPPLPALGPSIAGLFAVPLGLAVVSGIALMGSLVGTAASRDRPLLLLILAGAIAQVLLLQRLFFRRAQAALGEAEAKFATIFRNSPDPMAIATLAEGCLLEVNDSLVDFLGYSPTELIGRTSLELNLWQQPSDRQRYRDWLHQHGRVRNLEVQVRTKAGELKTGLLSAEVQILKGQPCVVSMLRDISDRQQGERRRQRAEAALKDSEARFRQLAEAVEEGFFVYETQAGHYSYVNPAYWRIRGISAEQDPGSEAEWLAGIHPDDRDRIAAALGRERQGENFDQEYRYTTPAGELRWLRSKAFPLRDEAGQVVRVVGTVEDITARKATEAALQDSEARFRSAFADAPYGISLVSATGRFVQANPCYCALLGYSEAELLGLTFADITHPDDRADDWAGFQRMMAGDVTTYEVEKRYLSKQGEVIPVVINAAPIYDGEGRPLYSVGHVQDIRDRLAISRLKDEFISVVSHELRTPITSIQGALALLGAGVYADRPEKARHMLDIAIGNSDRLVRLVDDILSFERLESGRVQLEKEACQVASLIYQAIDSVQPLADQSGITLAVTPLNTSLWAAPDAILQVLTNLLSNAIKFSQPGGTVWLQAKKVVPDVTPPAPTDRPTPTHRPAPTAHAAKHRHPLPPSIPTAESIPHLLLTVRDHGRGIPADKLEVIFEQFQQVDVSDARMRGGTGLGLAICKRIVQQHRGHIWVESTLGQGSCFSVALPLEVDGDLEVGRG
jgi:PAS domain S-box-containing protein